MQSGPTCTSVDDMSDKQRPDSRPNHGTCNATRRPTSVSARLERLQFHESGKFRVLQLSDIQDGPKVSSDTIRLITAAIDAARPDIVIFTGNQIAGYDGAYAATFRKRTWRTPLERIRQNEASHEQLDHARDLVRQSIGEFLQPLIDRGIPWVVTYGNHDSQCGLSREEMDAIYREFPGCLNAESTASRPDLPRTRSSSGLPDQRIYPCEAGTLALPVMDVDRKHTVLGLAVVDSGDYARSGGYGSPSGAALKFLGLMPDVLHTRMMVFQHFPIPQYYRLLKSVPPNAAHAVEGYRVFSGHSYVLDEDKTLPGSYLGEGVSCPDADSGEYAILTNGDRYFAICAGHDHRNGFAGEVDGMLMVASPTCGFGSYGPAPARVAARLFEFDIRHPYHPRTQLLEFGDLVGKPNSHKTYTFAIASEADQIGESMDLLRKPGLLGRLRRALRKK